MSPKEKVEGRQIKMKREEQHFAKKELLALKIMTRALSFYFFDDV